MTGDTCLRGAQLARSLKRERGGGQVSWAAVPGLRGAGRVGPGSRVRGGRGGGPAARAAGVDVIALGCPHASAVAASVKLAAGEGIAVVDSAALAAERVRRHLMRGRLTTTRRRQGRCELVSTNPAAAQAGLAARA